MSWLHLRFTLLGGLLSPTASEVYRVQDLLSPTAPASIRAKLLKLQDLMTSFLSVQIRPMTPTNVGKNVEKLELLFTAGGAGVALLPNCGETWLLKAVL